MTHDLKTLEEKFNSCCFTLDREDILKFDQDDNGPINNVRAGINDHCFGVKLYDDHIGLTASMFYINGCKGLKGDIIELDIDDEDYFTLLLRFGVLLSLSYDGVDAIDAFNTFQNKLRGFLEKLGFFTVTNFDLKPFEGKSAIMMSSSKRGILKLTYINKVEYYKEFFDNVKYPIIPKQEHVYLMVNTDTSLIKIGTSKNPGYRERTLHSQEPSVHLIAKWCCGKKIERELHDKYAAKRIRGEWFRLTIPDLADIETYMNNIPSSTTTANLD